MMVWKMIFLCQGCILRFHLNLPGYNPFFLKGLFHWMANEFFLLVDFLSDGKLHMLYMLCFGLYEHVKI